MKALLASISVFLVNLALASAQTETKTNVQLGNVIQHLNWSVTELANTSSTDKAVVEKEFHFRNAKGLRLHFDKMKLPERGLIEVDNSINEVLKLDQRRLEALNFTTPYLSGDKVRIKLVLAAKTELKSFGVKLAETVVLKTVKEKSICGPSDDREPSSSPQFARTMKVADGGGGCTGTMVGPTCMVSAGHCINHMNVAQFNVPESNSDGSPNYPGPEDQYALNKVYGYQDSGPGLDWAVVSLKANAITGALPGTRQGYLPTSLRKPQVGQSLQITGYGIDRNQPRRRVTQQTHFGELTSLSSATLYYNVDTEPGNSGSTIIDASSQTIIGIHSHGGCYRSGGANKGTSLARHSRFQKALEKCLADDASKF